MEQSIAGIILAGGAATRMQGADKGAIRLGGKRLIEHVMARIAPQVSRVMISGPQDYGLDVPFVPDLPDGPEGPVAGIYAAYQALTAQGAAGFVTVPVDGPFLPMDLVARLSASGTSAVAVDRNGLHPTFALWDMAALAVAWPKLGAETSPSLRRLASLCGMSEVRWEGDEYFRNINTPDDLEQAALLYRAKGID